MRENRTYGLMREGRPSGLLSTLPFTTDVIRLADELKISLGIVAGRFQRLTKKWNYFNGLKRKFQWTA
jgi:hypothetical protein